MIGFSEYLPYRTPSILCPISVGWLCCWLQVQRLESAWHLFRRALSVSNHLHSLPKYAFGQDFKRPYQEYTIQPTSDSDYATLRSGIFAGDY